MAKQQLASSATPLSSWQLATIPASTHVPPTSSTILQPWFAPNAASTVSPVSTHLIVLPARLLPISISQLLPVWPNALLDGTPTTQLGHASPASRDVPTVQPATTVSNASIHPISSIPQAPSATSAAPDASLATVPPINSAWLAKTPSIATKTGCASPYSAPTVSTFTQPKAAQTAAPSSKTVSSATKQQPKFATEKPFSETTPAWPVPVSLVLPWTKMETATRSVETELSSNINAMTATNKAETGALPTVLLRLAGPASKILPMAQCAPSGRP